MCALAIREIESATELESLRADWLALWKRSSTSTPFQAPDWLIPWWKHFGVGQLYVLAVTEEQRLVGLAPLFVANARTLTLLGTSHSDYLDILVDDRVCNDAAVAIFSHLCANRRTWNECDFQNLRHTSPLLTMKSCEGLREQLQEQNFCPVTLLPATEQRFLDSLSHRLRQNLDYYRRRLSTLGEVVIERAGEYNFAELFDAFVKLHEARWRMNSMPGVLCDGKVESFHREAATGFLASGALRLYALRINGRIIASLYGFHHAARTYYYLGGFDPEFKQYSPGTVLVAHAITTAIREGAREFDFLRGREDYKYRWGAVDRTIYRKRLCAASVFSVSLW
jgi:CelD/BcsL family acetyltransferase involved in cellulose biosynthesis